MRPLCPISSHVKHVSAVWQQVLGVRGPTLGSHPLSQCPNFPWAGYDPSAHAARLLSGVLGCAKKKMPEASVYTRICCGVSLLPPAKQR